MNCSSERDGHSVSVDSLLQSIVWEAGRSSAHYTCKLTRGEHVYLHCFGYAIWMAVTAHRWQRLTITDQWTINERGLVMQAGLASPLTDRTLEMTTNSYFCLQPQTQTQSVNAPKLNVNQIIIRHSRADSQKLSLDEISYSESFYCSIHYF